MPVYLNRLAAAIFPLDTAKSRGVFLEDQMLKSIDRCIKF